MVIKLWLHAQVAVVACQLAVHCRRTEDMGILSLQAFQTAVTNQRMQVPHSAYPLPTLSPPRGCDGCPTGATCRQMLLGPYIRVPCPVHCAPAILAGICSLLFYVFLVCMYCTAAIPAARCC